MPVVRLDYPGRIPFLDLRAVLPDAVLLKRFCTRDAFAAALEPVFVFVPELACRRRSCHADGAVVSFVILESFFM